MLDYNAAEYSAMEIEGNIIILENGSLGAFLFTQRRSMLHNTKVAFLWFSA
jgi:hypothetical protein